MQVPASEYMYAAYGAYAEVGSELRKFVFRLFYMERPEFRANGFADKDSIAAVTIGGQIVGTKNSGLVVMIGPGRASGYVKVTEADLPSVGFTKGASNSYTLNGMLLEADYEFRMSGFQFAVGHQSLSGVPDNRQFAARVGYTFPSFTIKLGYRH